MKVSNIRAFYLFIHPCFHPLLSCKLKIFHYSIVTDNSNHILRPSTQVQPLSFYSRLCFWVRIFRCVRKTTKISH